MKELTENEFNSWACDIQNDYDQAWREMGPDDYESREDYFTRRMMQAGIIPPNAFAYFKNRSLSYKIKPMDNILNDDDLPF